MMTSNKEKQKQNALSKNESSEDIERNEIEEGKTCSATDFWTKSPNIKKKSIDFGNTASLEKVWISCKIGVKEEVVSKQVEIFNQKEISMIHVNSLVSNPLDEGEMGKSFPS